MKGAFAGKKAKQILLIDDEPDFIDALAPQLRTKGFRVSSALDGLQGLEQAKEHAPDLILLDITMPEMDGFEVLQRLRGDLELRRVPVIMVTARGETEAILRATGWGSVDYIIKPFNLDELLSLIGRYLPV